MMLFVLLSGRQKDFFLFTDESQRQKCLYSSFGHLFDHKPESCFAKVLFSTPNTNKYSPSMSNERNCQSIQDIFYLAFVGFDTKIATISSVRVLKRFMNVNFSVVCAVQLKCGGNGVKLPAGRFKHQN